jgi:hypothetical protein
MFKKTDPMVYPSSPYPSNRTAADVRHHTL